MVKEIGRGDVAGGASGVSGVRHDEATAFVEIAKYGAPLLDG
jgi:hypothetical protein